MVQQRYRDLVLSHRAVQAKQLQQDRFGRSRILYRPALPHRHHEIPDALHIARGDRSEPAPVDRLFPGQDDSLIPRVWPARPCWSC